MKKNSRYLKQKPKRVDVDKTQPYVHAISITPKNRAGKRLVKYMALSSWNASNV